MLSTNYIEELEKRVQHVETTLVDVTHVLWGDSERRNGLRPHVARHARYIGHLVRRADESDKAHRHYLDKRRLDTCFGIEELKKHLKEHESMSAHDLAVELAKMQGESKKWDRVILLIIGAMSTAATLVTVLK